MAASRFPGPVGSFFHPRRAKRNPFQRRGFPPGPLVALSTASGKLVRAAKGHNCTRGATIEPSSGKVEHSGFPFHPKFFGRVQGVTGVHVWVGEKAIAHNMVLSFEANDVSQANWLQFLGASVVAVTDKGDKRLAGRITFTKPVSKTPVSVETTVLPSDTQYMLDSEVSGPFASSRHTAVCESLSSGKEKISFFDQPIGNIDGASKALSPFLADFENSNSGVLEALVLAADFYSYLVVSNTTIYLIRWKAEHEFLVTPEGKELLQADYRQFVLDDECGPVAGIGDHRAILENAFPNVVIY
jgi:hypothetical protein